MKKIPYLATGPFGNPIFSGYSFNSSGIVLIALLFLSILVKLSVLKGYSFSLDFNPFLLEELVKLF